MLDKEAPVNLTKGSRTALHADIQRWDGDRKPQMNKLELESQSDRSSVNLSILKDGDVNVNKPHPRNAVHFELQNSPRPALQSTQTRDGAAPRTMVLAASGHSGCPHAAATRDAIEQGKHKALKKTETQDRSGV